jgi:organic hydroperoxide reductase OsmC/OhrA
MSDPVRKTCSPYLFRGVPGGAAPDAEWPPASGLSGSFLSPAPPLFCLPVPEKASDVRIQTRNRFKVMENGAHRYDVQVRWTGNLGEGTRAYRAYARAHEITAAGKPVVPGSSDPAFRGDPARYNPEELLVASLSACHMLWYLHLCADAGLVVTAYEDRATGTMRETPDGGGCFTEVVLRPDVTFQQDGDAALAAHLHERAHQLCFIASSVNFPVRCEPVARMEPAAGAPSLP